MSHVDNVLISWDIMEDEDARTADINGWLKENDPRQQQLIDIAGHPEAYGGHKHMETTLLAAAFNYAPEHELLEFLATLPWSYPENVQYIVKRQHSDVFEVVFPCKP